MTADIILPYDVLQHELFDFLDSFDQKNTISALEQNNDYYVTSFEVNTYTKQKELLNMPNLKHLNLGRTYHIKSKHIEKLTNLRSLVLGVIFVDESHNLNTFFHKPNDGTIMTIDGINKLKKLKVLDLSYSSDYYRCRDLIKLKYVDTLKLYCSDATNKKFWRRVKLLKRHSNMKIIITNQNKINKELKKLKKLKSKKQ